MPWTGEGVHVVTVNEYLAMTLPKWANYTILGLSVGLNINSKTADEKRSGIIVISPTKVRIIAGL